LFTESTTKKQTKDNTSTAAENRDPSITARYFEQRGGETLETIRQLVEMESPSDNKEAVDRLGESLARKFSELGGRVRFHRTAKVGDHLQVDFASSDDWKPVLLLGQIETIYPIGTLAQNPYRVADGPL